MVGHDAGPVSTTQRPASGQPRRRVDGRLVILLVVVALYSRGTLTGSLNRVVVGRLARRLLRLGQLDPLAGPEGVADGVVSKLTRRPPASSSSTLM
jgi:hypothetical protein